jgi:hypothetical protein
MPDANDRSQETGSKGQLARADRAWRGDEHALQVAAAKEAGLPAGQAAIDLYTEGFRRGLQERDPADGAIVLRGRTVLRAEEMMRSLKPMLRFLRIGPDSIGLRVVEGEFELRVAGQAADASEPVQGAVRTVLMIWIASGLIGFALLGSSQMAALLVWGIGLLVGASALRRGQLSGRTMLAARLAVGLGILAHEEQLILPPVGGRDGGT